MSYWFERCRLDSDPLRSTTYKVGDTVVHVAGRPDYRPEAIDKNYLAKVYAWLSVTDRFVPPPPGAYSQWSPWIENGPPDMEVLFTCLKVLHYWIDELKLPEVVIHCDAGTHRSVTVFGAYLRTYHPEKAQEISDNFTMLNRDHRSDPLEYWDSYVEECPHFKKAIEYFKNTEDDPEWGNESLERVLSRAYCDEPEVKDECGVETQSSWARRQVWKK
ncbi:MAG: hypothetical protein OIN85_01085 [Candidatus Methanoperedens sp.]|nr:hypothetical protein [Candidatus Methanoperedens sp.]